MKYVNFILVMGIVVLMMGCINLQQGNGQVPGNGISATAQTANLSVANSTVQGQSTVPTTSTAQASASDTVEIPLSEISGTVKKYTYDSDGVSITYIAVKGSDGEVRTAFDACEICYRAKKGYVQIGNSVKCNNCGLQFNIDDLGTKNKGKGCWPAYLPSEVQGNTIIIKRSDLQAGEYLFS
jgi:uncharacterized membrane protein